MNIDHFALMAIEFWKLIRSYERSLSLLPPEHQAKIQAQVRYSARRLETLLDDTDIRLVSFDGRVFEPNLPITAVNAEDFDNNTDNLVVDQTIEPAVMNNSTVIIMGKVVLAIGEENVSGN